MRSLRARLILTTTLATLVIFLAASILLYLAIRNSLLAELDSSLVARMRLLAATVEIKSEGLRLDMEPEALEKLAIDRPDEGFILLSSDGKTVSRSLSLASTDWSAVRSGEVGAEDYGFLEQVADPRVRYLALRFVPRIEDKRRALVSAHTPVTLVVGRDMGNLDAKLRQLLALLAVVFVATAVTSGGIMAWLVRRGLGPLSTLAHSLQTLGDGDMARRVALPNPPAELEPVVARLNELLARVESAFERERAFTADVAHELRTPLAGLTTALEVTAAHNRTPGEYEKVIGKCLRATRGMHGMVENLLTLARVEARQLTPQIQTVDLAELLPNAWQEFAPRAAERRLRVEWWLAQTLTVETDPALFQTVLRNLFDNAVTYADDGGVLRISGKTEQGVTQLQITNSGSAVSAADVSHVFDRFWRGDAARSATGQHCGMGLALCQRIMALLGGAITASSELNGEFSVTVRISAK